MLKRSDDCDLMRWEDQRPTWSDGLLLTADPSLIAKVELVASRLKVVFIEG